MIEDDADRLAYLSDFGEAFTVSGVTGQVIGIHDAPYVEPFAEVESAQASILFRALDVPAIAQGDAITRASNGVQYTVENVQPDGIGMVIVNVSFA